MKKTALALAASLLFTGNFAYALTEGTDYTVLKQTIPQTDNSKIEVLEFFSYSCIHCYNLDPILLKHSKSFASDTYLRTEHVVWDNNMLNLARIAAAVNSSNTKTQANPVIFNAMFEQKVNLADPKTFESWAARQNGFAPVLSAYHSLNNPVQARRMQDITKQYAISATPLLIIGGKYQVKMHDLDSAMNTVDQLIAKVRTERGMKAAAPRVLPKSIGGSLANVANH
ncbi:thiol:disulfide interchange protein DsbA/DsbL [Stenoxybacter acetivorans]|uniref:thiol:disulfide interchange protein DsbA/DsbL n=1 Tax=Stenoxybacter acetivorans TaxID=422441 RepID=UPI00056D730D|nr:thiol:disulfide interchange protein DsbA/DsbL [Stenoxybacter acetivorans]